MLIAVVGATGTGKSALSLDIAEALIADGQPAEIIGADAMQLYRGMDIGTAKLPVEARRGIPHRLLDVLSPTQETSVAHYQEEARKNITELLSRGIIPILVGGSGLYLSSVLYDFRFPGTDPQIRASLEKELAEHGQSTLFQRLSERDPQAAEAIGPYNTRRLVRALEVIKMTGEPYGAGLPDPNNFWLPTVVARLSVERTTLVKRLNRRVQGMWDQGLLSETDRLRPAGFGVTASRAIGYAQALAQLDGKLSEVAAIQQASTLTRRYARRQVSWFARYPVAAELNPDDPEHLNKTLTAIRSAQEKTRYT